MQVLNTLVDPITVSHGGKDYKVGSQSYLTIEGSGPLTFQGTTYGHDGGAFGSNSIIYTTGDGLAGASPY